MVERERTASSTIFLSPLQSLIDTVLTYLQRYGTVGTVGTVGVLKAKAGGEMRVRRGGKDKHIKERES